MVSWVPEGEHQRADQRRLRAQPPAHQDGYSVYASDGASRGQGQGTNRSASCGAAKYGDDGRTVVAAYRRVLGNVSNNVAEYKGLIFALECAVQHPTPRIKLRVHSLLLAHQLKHVWRCHSVDLIARFEYATDLFRILREGVESAEVVHDYREYNSDADSICNQDLELLASGVNKRAAFQSVVAIIQ